MPCRRRVARSGRAIDVAFCRVGAGWDFRNGRNPRGQCTDGGISVPGLRSSCWFSLQYGQLQPMSDLGRMTASLGRSDWKGVRMIRKLAVALSICAFALPVLWGTAQARSVPFLSGHTTDANRLTCVAMEQFKGTVFNLVGPFSLDNSQCGQGLIYELPLTVDNG